MSITADPLKMFICSLLAMGVVGCFVIGGILLKTNFKIEEDRKELLENGVVTKASFVRKETQETQRLNQQNSRYQQFSSYQLTYRFDAKSHSKGTISFKKALAGEEQDFDLSFDYKEFTISVGKETYHNTSYGDRIKVMYLKDRPQVFEVLSSDETFPSNNRLYYAIALFALGILSIKLLHQYLTTGKTW